MHGDPVPRTGENLDDPAEVHLAGGVVGLDPAQGRGEQRPAEAPNPGGHLVDGGLVADDVAMVDDPGDRVVAAAAHHPHAAPGIVDVGGEQRGRGVVGPVGGDQRGEVLAPQQRHVGVDDEHAVVVAPEGQIVVVEGAQAGERGIAGTAPHGLLDELGARLGVLQLLGDAVAALAHHHDHAVHVDPLHRVEHEPDHRSPAQAV